MELNSVMWNLIQGRVLFKCFQLVCFAVRLYLLTDRASGRRGVTSVWMLNPSVWEYVRSTGLRDDALLARLREETRGIRFGHMQVAPEQGQLLGFLVGLLGVRRILEIGVFTGYSSLCMARNLPEDGYMLALDNQPKFTAIAERYWKEAGVSGRIELRHCDAFEEVSRLCEDEAVEPFDLIFLDADKGRYPGYYERCLSLLAPRGLLILDNVLWYGNVTEISHQEDTTRAIRKVNEMVHDDPRVEHCLLPFADGMTLVRKL